MSQFEIFGIFRRKNGTILGTLVLTLLQWRNVFAPVAHQVARWPVLAYNVNFAISGLCPAETSFCGAFPDHLSEMTTVDVLGALQSQAESLVKANQPYLVA